MSRIYVIAGNSTQASDWIKSNLDLRSKSGETTLSWSEYYIVNRADSIRGVNDPHGVFVGTWRDRTDLDEIFVSLLRSTDITSNSHRTINRIWSDWKDND
jgi:hypothetical protein